MKNFVNRRATSINVLLGAAVVFVVLRTWLLHTPEVFSYGSEISEVVYDACLAYATAWLFQWLVIVRPEGRERERLHEVIAPRIDHVVKLGIELGSVIRTQGGLAPAFPVPRPEVESILTATNPRDDAPGWLADWHQVLDELSAEAAVQRSALKPFYAKLDHRLLTLLELEEARMALLARVGRASAVVTWESMERFVAPVADWLDAAEALRQYRITDLAPKRPTPELDSSRFEFQRVPISEMAKMRRDIDELVGGLTDEDPTSGRNA
ncbi:hypothetical protein [Kribbella sp. NPDC006257]|uniref:hypothetical protein n=1 Tax=Kribbella sp. NPDC006257 TaxID=3156738 RepID=UPI0033A75939